VVLWVSLIACRGRAGEIAGPRVMEREGERGREWGVGRERH